MPEPTVAPAAESISSMRTRRRWRTWLVRFAMAIGGVAVALVIAEVIFRYRDDGAFPHLNVYRGDPVLGVRLEPGATERVKLGGNPVTSVRINADGYRGDDWPAPGANEIAVVGDSQVFGLGVEQDETFSAKLAGQLHATVLNAGVPTYGPDEYRAVIAELLATRHPKTVVVALNIANDLFEVAHPNRTRHVVWDGWAVRKENAPDEVTEFPGRDFVFRRSHVVFALRQWWHDEDEIDERGFASEGTWHDLIATGRDLDQQREAMNDRRRKLAHERRRLQQDLAGADKDLETAFFEVLGGDAHAQYQDIRAGRASTGDIVGEGLFEGARSVVVTAEMIRTGAEVRDKLRTRLAAWAKQNRGKQSDTVKTSLEVHDRALARLTEVDAHRIAAALEPPLLPFVRDVTQLCANNGARLVVVVLPIDVQVSATEWAKYGAAPLDMASTKQFTDELVRETEALGISALDASKPLAAAEPGAFLDHDIHMTPKGHAAVATALAAVLAAPPPARRVVSDRSPVPVPAVWQRAPEIIVTGSTSAGCETKQVREWLRVICGRTEDGGDPTAVKVERDDGGDALALAMPHQTSLVAPLVPGRETVALFGWTDHTRRLRLSWPAGAAKPTLAFDAPTRTGGRRASFNGYRFDFADQPFASPVERALCACWGTVYDGRSPGSQDAITCSGAYGTADKRCYDRYRNGSCQQMIECSWRDPASPP